MLLLLVVHFYSVLENSGSEPQQTKSFGYSYTGTWKSRHWSMEPTKMYGRKAILSKYVFLMKDLIVIGSGFQIAGVATEKVCLPILDLVLGTNSCLKTDDLRILRI